MYESKSIPELDAALADIEAQRAALKDQAKAIMAVRNAKIKAENDGARKEWAATLDEARKIRAQKASAGVATVGTKAK